MFNTVKGDVHKVGKSIQTSCIVLAMLENRVSE